MTITSITNKIGRQDINYYDGVLTTFSRQTSTGGTLTCYKVGNTVDISAVYGSNTAKTSAVMNVAIAAIGSNNVPVEISPGTWTVTANVTFPANITVIRRAGAKFDISDGYGITFNGQYISEGTDQNFDDANSDYDGVTFGAGSVDFVRPEWWVTNTSPGSTDMAAALQAAINRGKDKAPVWLSDSYYFNTNLTNHGTAILGIPSVAKLIAGASVTVGITLYKPTLILAPAYSYFIPIHGFELNGAATGSDAIGIQVGDTGDPGLCYELSNLVVHSFDATDGKGIRFAQAQTCSMHHCHLHGNYVNLWIKGVTNIYPTTLSFYKNTYRYATKYGVFINTGTNLTFSDEVYESNYEEGFFVQSSLPFVSGQQITLSLKNAYFESNWLDDAGRATEFSCVMGGSGIAGTTVSSIIDNASFDTGAANPLAIQYTTAINSVARGLKLATQTANCIEVNTATSQVLFDDMVNYNFASILNNVDSSVYVQGDSLPWVSWSPSYSVDGGGSYGTITTTFAKYKIMGKTVHVRLNFTGTLVGASTTTITLTLPTGLTPNNLIANSCVALDAAAQVAGRIETVGDNITIAKLPVGNFTAGAGVGALASLTFDLQ